MPHMKQTHKMVTPVCSCSCSCSLPNVVVVAALILLSMSSSTASNNKESRTDREALLCLRSHLSDPRGALATWSRNSSLDSCHWHGVSCSKRRTQRRVTALDLEGQALAGRLPPCVSNLTRLARIHLANNRLTGGVPPELGLLAGLTYLDLSNNALGGKIPANLSSCSALELLALESNSLQGEIPPRLAASLPSLRFLFLRNNSLSGAAPASMFNGPSIEKIDLSMNQLSGPIPVFSSSTNSSSALRLIDLAWNSFSGEIPSTLGNLTSLTSLVLYGNQLQGAIPRTLVRASRLEFLDLTQNNLSGTVPIFVYNFTLLQYLGLGNNAFTGRLPSDMGNTLPNLQILAMAVNHLDGPIPSSLNNATNLEGIYLASNNFSGVIPSFGSLPNLDTLMMYTNILAAGDWAFLSSLTNCTRLASINFSVNNLRGDLPKYLANLSKSLEVFDLGLNHISGTIPDEIHNLLNLTMLYLDDNMLTGKIPSTIGHLYNLGYLMLSRNQLYGEIPSSLGNLDRLNTLDLQENNLTGTIPVDLSRCKNLLALNLSCNSLWGNVPTKLFSGLNQLSLYLDLSYNQLTSSMPFEMGGLINLISFNISHNKFTNQIPSTLGTCLLLQSVHMEGNQLGGSIPQSLMNLKGIMELDFSQNNLSGEIPLFFENFTTLEYLNLSFNNLNGPVPLAGVFAKASKVFIQGNPRLCTDMPMLQLPLCSASEHKRKHPLGKPLVAVVALIGALLVVFMVIIVLRKRRKIISPVKLNHPGKELTLLSYSDLRRATDGFSSSNLIGTGQFGEVYKGVLDSEADPVAIKVFKLNEYGAFDSFIAECDALRYIRHRNLVKVITVCSTCDRMGNEFKALVLEFMVNGTLDSRIHNKLHHYADLNLAAKICIAVDIASALDYLHNRCVQLIVHCDLKPSNILFDDSNNARVCDFGLARFLHGCYSPTGHHMPMSFVGPRGSAGYIAPEYAMGSKISTDGDIYSFGIIVLEMLTRKRPTDGLFKDGLTLRKYVEDSYPHYIEVLDPDILEYFKSDQAIHASRAQEQPAIAQVQNCIVELLKIGLICSSDAPGDRPNAHDVYNNLIEVREELNAYETYNSSIAASDVYQQN